MKDNYDFSKAIKNPYTGKLNNKCKVTVYDGIKTKSYVEIINPITEDLIKPQPTVSDSSK